MEWKNLVILTHVENSWNIRCKQLSYTKNMTPEAGKKTFKHHALEVQVDQTLPLRSNESFAWIILTWICLFDAWKKFQNMFSQMVFFKMVIYHGRIRKKITNKIPEN